MTRTIDCSEMAYTIEWIVWQSYSYFLDLQIRMAYTMNCLKELNSYILDLQLRLQ